MIDPFTAFAALKAASSSISSAIKVGRDLTSMGGAVAKWAKAEASLQVVANQKPGVFGKLTGAEQNAIDAHFRNEEAKRLRDEMRELFVLYGSPGQWDRLQSEIAAERARPSSTLRSNLKNKQKIANEIGTKGTRPNQAFLGGSASQIPKSKTKKTKRLVDIQKRSPSRKTNKKLGPYRSGNVLQNIVDSNKKAFPLKKKAGGKTTKYMARGGKTSKYMAKGGRAK